MDNRCGNVQAKCEIDILTDENLLEVFLYLPLQELPNVELVCKRWRRVTGQRWRALRRLNVAELTGVRPFDNCEVQYYTPKLTASGLSNLAKKCGKNLREFTVGCRLKIELNCLKILASDFPRLQLLDLSKTVAFSPENMQNDAYCSDFDMCSVFGSLSTLRMEACFDDSALCYHSFEGVDVLLFKFFSAMPYAKSVSLGHNTLINGSSLLGLSTSVESLDLSFCRRVTADTLILMFSSLPNLMHVSLYSNNRLSGVCLNYLPSNLESADLSYCDALDAESLSNFIRTHRNLKALQMAHVRAMSNRILSSIAEHLQNLQSLSLSCYFKTSYYEDYQHACDITKGVKSLSALKHLKQLDLSKNDFVTDAALIGLSHGCTLLEDLNVSQLANVNPIGFACLGRLLLLRKLDISDNDCVDETVLLSVAHGGNLEFVDARRCAQISEDTLKRLGEFWPNKMTVFQVF